MKNLVSPYQEIISSYQLFSKNVTFTRFLPKMCETKSMQFPHYICIVFFLFLGWKNQKVKLREIDFLEYYLTNLFLHFTLHSKINKNREIKLEEIKPNWVNFTESFLQKKITIQHCAVLKNETFTFMLKDFVKSK